MNEISGFELNGKRINLHPVMVEALRGFAPPTSSIFDSVRQPEEDQACNDDTAKPTKFFVRTARARPFFAVYGRDRVTVQRQHEDLCPAGEQCIVLTEDEYRQRLDRAFEHDKETRLARADEARAMKLQEQHPSEFDRVWGRS